MHHHRLPLDDFLQRRGIFMASKCRCCRSGHIETFDHVFAGGEVASMIWRVLASITGLRTSVNFDCMVHEWFSSPKLNSQMGLIRILCFGIGVWEIWKARCQEMFGTSDDKWVLSEEGLRRRVRDTIFARQMEIRPRMRATLEEERLIGSLGLQIIAAKEISAASLWRPLSTGVTVNMMIKGSRGVMLMRDEQGRFILATGWNRLRTIELGGIPDILRHISLEVNRRNLRLGEVQWDMGAGRDTDRHWSAVPFSKRIPPWKFRLIKQRSNEAASSLLATMDKRKEFEQWSSKRELHDDCGLIV
uniref:Reverse transcriptase zinc-binding domain-containing protein n=1 Tax=Kalanchoe fedtschenkoi TaxID=63787 RepID=A0A7N0V7F4_KALFE